MATPLDPSSYLGNPCELVSDSVVRRIDKSFSGGRPDVDSEMARKLAGPGCEWDAADDYGLNVDLRIQTVHQRVAEPHLKGIAGVYGSKEDGLVDFLNPMEIAGHSGYPAVHAGVDDDPEKGRCVLFVGLSDDLTFKSSVLNKNEPELACAGAATVAAAVLDTLKSGG